MKKFIEENKAFIIFYAVLLVTALLYAVFTSQSRETDKVVFLVLSGISVVFLLCKLVFSDRKTSLIWVLFVFAMILTFVYMLTPTNRIYSHHGFMHAGITYQILNGEIPPKNPLLAGEELLYPWGYEFAGAAVTYIFNISPFYSYAILNIASLIAVMFLVYKICQLLTEDNNACIFSVIISMYGITIFNKYLLVLFRGLNFFGETNPFFPEYRGLPVFTKFFNINGTPLGLVFYLVFLYSVIKIFIGKKTILYSVFVFLSLLATGFIYPQFLPGAVASALCICLVNGFTGNKEKTGYLRKVFLTITPLIIGLLFISPYFFSISSGIKGGVELFKSEPLLLNAVSSLIIFFPILIVIFLNRKYLWNLSDRGGLFAIIAATIAALGCYICMHMSYHNEYKSLVLAEITLGILGGIALSNMKQWCNKIIVFVLLIAFAFPMFDIVNQKLSRFESIGVMFEEKGKALCAKDTEENELYEWIRSQTNVSDVFFDTTPNIPVLAQRQLFIGMDATIKGKDKKGQPFQIYNPGYDYGIKSHLENTCGYDTALVRGRYEILRNIYNPKQKLTKEQTEQLFSSNNKIYIIVRRESFPKSYKYRDFDKVFQSSRSNYSVYRYDSNKPIQQP